MWAHVPSRSKWAAKISGACSPRSRRPFRVAQVLVSTGESTAHAGRRTRGNRRHAHSFNAPTRLSHGVGSRCCLAGRRLLGLLGRGNFVVGARRIAGGQIDDVLFELVHDAIDVAVGLILVQHAKLQSDGRFSAASYSRRCAVVFKIARGRIGPCVFHEPRQS